MTCNRVVAAVGLMLVVMVSDRAEAGRFARRHCKTTTAPVYCTMAPLPDVSATDEEAVVSQLRMTLARTCDGELVRLAKLTVMVLQVNPNFPARPTVGEQGSNARDYWSMLNETQWGRAIAKALRPIYETSHEHPVLSDDQLLLLRVAVALATTDGDIETEVLAWAHAVAGQLIVDQAAGDNAKRDTLLALPHYAAAFQLASEAGNTELRSQLAELLFVNALPSNSQRHRFSEYYNVLNSAMKDENGLQASTHALLRLVNQHQGDQTSGPYLFYLHGVANRLAAWSLIDVNGDGVTADMYATLAIDCADDSPYMQFKSWVSDLTIDDQLREKYISVLATIKDTAVKPAEDQYLSGVLAKNIREVLIAESDALRSTTAILFDDLRSVPVELVGRLTLVGKWW